MSDKKLLFILSNADPARPDSCYAPLFQSTVAAALGHEVEVIFTGSAVKMAIQGVAEKIEVNLESHRTIHDLIREAHNAGVSFKACNTSINVAAAEMIEELDERVGAAYVVNEALEENTTTFTY